MNRRARKTPAIRPPLPAPPPTDPIASPPPPGERAPAPPSASPRRRCRAFAPAVAGATLLLVSVPGPAPAEVRIEIDGLPEALETNVRLSVGTPRDERERTLNRFVEAVPEQASRALAALGYYAADIDVDERVEGEDTVVAISVAPNDPVRVERIDLNVTGPAREDPEYMPVVGQIPLRRGQVFVSSDHEGAKGVLAGRAQDLGYFDFAFSDTGVRVSRRNLTADITLVAESGPRYTFGEIVFDTDVLSDAFLSRWLPFAEGDPYESSLIGELTRNLQNSGYFESVRVVPQRDRRYGKTVPVRVTLRRKDQNLVGLGIGYSTEDNGPRGRVTWEKPLINRRGHSASAELGLSAVRQSASVAYRIPRGRDPLRNYYSLEYGLRNEDRDDDVESFLSTLNVQRVRRLDHDWTESLFVRWERETSTVADVERRTDLVLPGVSYGRTRSKGRPFLSWGQSTAFQFLYGSRKLLSTIDFYKSTVSFKYLRAVTPRNTLIGTVQYGAISTNDFDRVPASQRFFAGGDRSIRGYKYRDVSPRNPEGEAVGGRYLEILNAEYNYRFLDRWSVAVFADAGRAFNTFDQPYSAGAGLGIRWQSPVGPFRIDLAHPVGDNDLGRGLRVHLSLGPDL